MHGKNDHGLICENYHEEEDIDDNYDNEKDVDDVVVIGVDG